MSVEIVTISILVFGSKIAMRVIIAGLVKTLYDAKTVSCVSAFKTENIVSRISKSRQKNLTNTKRIY